MRAKLTLFALTNLRRASAKVALSMFMVSLVPGLAHAGPASNSGARVPINKVIATVTTAPDAICITVSPDNSTVYVANGQSNSVTVIDATNNYSVKATIATGLYSCFYLTLNASGKTLYVSNATAYGTVSVIDTTQSSYPIVATLNAGRAPQGLAITPDGTELYVTDFGNPYRALKGTVSVFDTATNKLKQRIANDGAPIEVLFTKQGKQANVLNSAGTGFLQFIDTASGIVSTSFGAAGDIFHPLGMVTNADATEVYVTDQENYVAVCNAADGTVSRKILAAPYIWADLSLGQPALTPDGQYLYVPYSYNNRSTKPDNQVAMIDVGTGKIRGNMITVGNYPYWAQASPDGKTLYVANVNDGTVTVIDISPQ
jgi:YVTN family beta-propeller protein